MRSRMPVILLLLVGCAAAARALATIKASLDQYQIASGDTVQLTLEHDGRTSGQPDVAPLQQDFDILGTSNSTTYELVNGSASEKTQVTLTLAPKVTGRLTIPALSWDGEWSRPLSLTVSGPGAGAGQSGASASTPAPEVFIRDTASPAQPYVEAAVHLTVRLFTSEPLYHADLELPDDSAVVVKQIGPDEDSNEVRGGRSYQVVTRKYLLFPLHKGKLTLQGPVLDAEVVVRRDRSAFGSSPFGGFFSGFFRTVAPLRVQGNSIVLSVRQRPAGAVGSYWLPADDVTVSASWNPAKLTAHAGDPVTLDLDLQATGLTAAQLPDLSSLMSVPAGLQAYPDQATLHDSVTNGRLIGSRDQTIALMADSPGRYTLPALTIRWWDTQDDQPRTATLPARTITILPASAGAAPAATAAAASPAPPPAKPAPAAAASRHAPPAAATQTPAPARSSSEWEWISIGLAFLWLTTLGAWLWSRRSRAMPPAASAAGARIPTRERSSNRAAADASRERAAFHAACEANDATAARAHLLAWTAALWGTPPAGINAIAARISDTAVVALLRDLDRACYAGGAWQGRPLAAALSGLPAPPGKPARGRDGLAPLYP